MKKLICKTILLCMAYCLFPSINANAQLSMPKIISSDMILQQGQQVPRFVRFCWHERAQPNLQNSAGLPAIPFAASVSE